MEAMAIPMVNDSWARQNFGIETGVSNMHLLTALAMRTL